MGVVEVTHHIILYHVVGLDEKKIYITRDDCLIKTMIVENDDNTLFFHH